MGGGRTQPRTAGRGRRAREPRVLLGLFVHRANPEPGGGAKGAGEAVSAGLCPLWPGAGTQHPAVQGRSRRAGPARTPSREQMPWPQRPSSLTAVARAAGAAEGGDQGVPLGRSSRPECPERVRPPGRHQNGLRRVGCRGAGRCRDRRQDRSPHPLSVTVLTAACNRAPSGGRLGLRLLHSCLQHLLQGLADGRCHVSIRSARDSQNPLPQDVHLAWAH